MTGERAILCLNQDDVAVTVNQCEPCTKVMISGLSRGSLTLLWRRIWTVSRNPRDLGSLCSGEPSARPARISLG